MGIAKNIERGKLLLLGAGSRMLKMIDDGMHFEKVTPETAQARIETCEGCELMTEDRQCRECGCLVDFKVTLKTNPILKGFGAEETDNKCPKGFW